MASLTRVASVEPSPTSVPRTSGSPVARPFTLVNRDIYPLRAALDLDAACQLVVRDGTAAEPRARPVFFAVDPAVANPAEEFRLRFETFAETRLGASFVVSMPGGSVLTEGFFTADQGGNLLSDSFRAYGMVARYGFGELGARRLERTLVDTQDMPGTAIVLGVQTNTNYFHWLLEALPRFWLAQQSPGLERASILVPPLTPWMAEMAAVCGVPTDQQLVPPADETRWKHLLVPARGIWNIHTFTSHAFALVDELRERVGPGHGGRPRRLFISRARSASRQIENEDEIFEIAASYGFERVFPEQLSFLEQVSLFAGAEAVAGALGAGLTNAVFMAPGSTLIEFAPEQRQGDAVLFANLAHHRRLRYAAVIGPLTGDELRPFDRRDFRIPFRTAAGAFRATMCY